MKTLREQLEAREREVLSPQAAKSSDSRGRLRQEREDDVRPAFQRDRDRMDVPHPMAGNVLARGPYCRSHSCRRSEIRSLF